MARRNSDHDMEHVDSSQLVRFHGVQDAYQPNEDIFVVYEIGGLVTPSSRDWVGLYSCGWKNLHDYVAFLWAPKEPRDPFCPALRSLLFQAKKLKVYDDPSQKFQFLYVSKQRLVLGVSKSFVIQCHVPKLDILDCLTRSVSLDGIDSLTIVEPKKGKSKKALLEKQESTDRVSSLELLFAEASPEDVDPGSSKTSKKPYAAVVATPRKNTKHSKPKNTKSIKRTRDSTSLKDASFKKSKVEGSSSEEDSCQWLFAIDPTAFSFSKSKENLDGNKNNSTAKVKKQENKEKELSLVSQKEDSKSKALIPANQQYSLVPYVPVLNTITHQSKQVIQPTFAISQHQNTLHMEDKLLQSMMQENLKTVLSSIAAETNKSTTANTCKKCTVLKRHLLQARRKMRHTQQQADTALDNLKSVESKLAFKDVIIEELSNQVKNLLKENCALNVAKDKMTTKLEVIRTENDRMAVEKYNLCTELENLKSELYKLNHKKQLIAVLLEANRGELETLKKKQGLLENQFVALQNSYKQCANDKTQLENVVNEKEEQVLRTRNLYEDKKKALASLRKNEQALSKTLTKVKKEKAGLAVRLREAEFTLKIYKDELQEKCEKQNPVTKSCISQTDDTSITHQMVQTTAALLTNTETQTKCMINDNFMKQLQPDDKHNKQQPAANDKQSEQDLTPPVREFFNALRMSGVKKQDVWPRTQPNLMLGRPVTYLPSVSEIVKNHEDPAVGKLAVDERDEKAHDSLYASPLLKILPKPEENETKTNKSEESEDSTTKSVISKPAVRRKMDKPSSLNFYSQDNGTQESVATTSDPNTAPQQSSKSVRKAPVKADKDLKNESVVVQMGAALNKDNNELANSYTNHIENSTQAVKIEASEPKAKCTESWIENEIKRNGMQDYGTFTPAVDNNMARVHRRTHVRLNNPMKLSPKSSKRAFRDVCRACGHIFPKNAKTHLKDLHMATHRNVN